MKHTELEWKGLCEIYGEQNLINAEIEEKAKRNVFLNCSGIKSAYRFCNYRGKYFSDRESEQLSHFAKQGVKVRLK